MKIIDRWPFELDFLKHFQSVVREGSFQSIHSGHIPFSTTLQRTSREYCHFWISSVLSEAHVSFDISRYHAVVVLFMCLEDQCIHFPLSNFFVFLLTLLPLIFFFFFTLFNERKASLSLQVQQSIF